MFSYFIITKRDELGWSTAINQYNTIISGAPGFSTDSIYYEGYTVIYEQKFTGLWNKVFDQIGLQNLDGHDMNHLGYSVDIDGYTAVAGAGYPGGWKDGYVSIFEHSIHGWSEVKKVFEIKMKIWKISSYIWKHYCYWG